MERADPQPRFAQSDPQRAPSLENTGYGAIVLDRLARQICRTAAVEWSCIFVRDRADPRSVIAAAGQGLPWDFLGARFGTDEGMIARVLATAETVHANYADLISPLALDGSDGASGVAVPIGWRGRVEGALTAATANPTREFHDEDVELLGELAELAAAALEDSKERKQFDQLTQAHVKALAVAMDMRDRRTANHSEDVVRLALRVGQAMNLEPASLLELEFAARLHDVGKIRVPDAVLHKPGPLDRDEYQVICCHSAWGAETLAGIPGLQAVAALVRFHHERWDGKGYPDGLSGGRIPLASRIISACDAYAAMTADRPYRRALDREHALQEVLAGSGTQFDPVVVTALVDVLGDS